MSRDSRRLKRFLLAVIIWLPLAFIGWAVLAQLLAWVPAWLSATVLTGVWPELFTSTLRAGTVWQLGTDIIVRQPGSQAVGQLLIAVDAMLYGYSLPLFFALMMALDLTPGKRLLQCATALPVLWLAQTFGMVSGALKSLQFDSGPQGAALAAQAGLSADVVALCYQFGYLILPAVTPVVLWVLLNRRFLETLGRADGEPAAR